MLIYVALMAEAFTGCLPPWGQMAYLGAQVIISLLDVIPGINYGFEQWLRGAIAVSGTTLNRFFALHIVAVPLALIGLVVFHLVAPPTILRHPQCRAVQAPIAHVHARVLKDGRRAFVEMRQFLMMWARCPTPRRYSSTSIHNPRAVARCLWCAPGIPLRSS